MLPETVAVLAMLSRLLNEAGVEYVVGGSMASAYHGQPRQTNDVDMVVDVEIGDAERLGNALRRDFYVDEDAVRDAISRRASFNVLDRASFVKVDFFVSDKTAWTQSRMARAQTVTLPANGGAVESRFTSPEDIVIQKLLWFRAGGEASERQWNDVRGVIEIQSGNLDLAYLSRWAREVGVSSLLERALFEEQHNPDR
jgi:hypothetical protein